jgi:hypothetical protein
MDFAALRSDEQSRMMWSALGDIAKQVKWMVDGESVYLDKEDWKYVVTAGLKRHQRIAKGIDGGFVLLGLSTRKLTKPEMSDLLEIIFSFGVERGVVWTEREGMPV